jgi:hypothetical protein
MVVLPVPKVPYSNKVETPLAGKLTVPSITASSFVRVCGINTKSSGDDGFSITSAMLISYQLGHRALPFYQFSSLTYYELTT